MGLDHVRSEIKSRAARRKGACLAVGIGLVMRGAAQHDPLA